MPSQTTAWRTLKLTDIFSSQDQPTHVSHQDHHLYIRIRRTVWTDGHRIYAGVNGFETPWLRQCVLMAVGSSSKSGVLGKLNLAFTFGMARVNCGLEQRTRL
jgi:hypothetical protein